MLENIRSDIAALGIKRLSWRRLGRAAGAVKDEFLEHDLLTHASNIAFRVLFALVPIVLLAFAGVGLFGLEHDYTTHLAPTLKRSLSPDAFSLTDRTLRRMMGKEHLFWSTIGLVLTVWWASSLVRSMTGALNAIYGAKEERTFWRRLLVSLAVGLVGVLFTLLALAAIMGGRLLHPSEAVLALLLTVGRWLVALVLLFTLLAMVLRFVPAKARPVRWVSLGSALVVLAWVGFSLGFALYIKTVSYTSVYGALAGFVILLLYLNYMAIAFLGGVVVDGLLRQEALGHQQRGTKSSKRKS